MRFFRDLSPSAFAAGFVAVLVGFTSSVALVFQAAQAFHATPEQITSWVWALGLGMGLCSLLPSLILRMPVMVAWSTPGAAVLANFGMQAFAAAKDALPLVLVMLLTYLLSRRLAPRYAVIATLAVSIAWVALTGQMQWSAVHAGLAWPVFTMPQFSVSALVSLALPLFVVTMASQNLPGVAVIRATGYGLPVSRLISMTGIATLLLAPFGGYALNLSAITAAICMGPEAHEDKSRRYTAAAVCGLFYIVIGIFGAVVTGLLTAFPRELVVCIAGLALLGSIGGGLATALQGEQHREAALITFLVTLSGVVIAGVGSAFWGVVAGSLALFVQHYRRARAG
jgi:benzoate membrane transport protein